MVTGDIDADFSAMLGRSFCVGCLYDWVLRGVFNRPYLMLLSEDQLVCLCLCSKFCAFNNDGHAYEIRWNVSMHIFSYHRHQVALLLTCCRMASETHTVIKDAHTPTILRNAKNVQQIGNRKLFVPQWQGKRKYDKGWTVGEATCRRVI